MPRGTTVKEVDAIIFRRVTKRLISDRVAAKDVERLIAQAKRLLEEVCHEVRYEKNILTYTIGYKKDRIDKSQKETDGQAVEEHE